MLFDLGIMNIDYDKCISQIGKSDKCLNELTLESCDSFYSFEGDISSLRMKHILCYPKAAKAFEKCYSGMNLRDS